MATCPRCLEVIGNDMRSDYTHICYPTDQWWVLEQRCEELNGLLAELESERNALKAQVAALTEALNIALEDLANTLPGEADLPNEDLRESLRVGREALETVAKVKGVKC